MLYLILAIMSSSLIAVIMRISTGKVRANFSMLAVNYITCLILSVIYVDFRILPLGAEGFPQTLGMGAVNGVLYLLGFVLLQYNTRKSGVVLSSVFMKLGRVTGFFSADLGDAHDAAVDRLCAGSGSYHSYQL